jgi:hypothetical protein
MEGSILSEENLEAVRFHLEEVGFVVVLHWHLYAGRSPTPLAFDDYDRYHDYLLGELREGDAIDVWPFPTDYGQRLAGGKKPLADGSILIGGAY